MGDTSISWTDKTWNPIRGCSRVSEGCRHCYAEAIAARFSKPGQPYEGLAKQVKRGVRQFKMVDGAPTGDFRTVNRTVSRWTGEVRMVPEHLADPLKWKKPSRIFVNSMSDLFHERLSNEQIAAVFGVMASAPQHTFQVLTKRAKRMREWFEWIASEAARARDAAVVHYENTRDMEVRICVAALDRFEIDRGHVPYPRWPLPNVWLGVSVENQDAGDERIPELIRVPAALRFLSCEPLLGPINLSRWLDALRWVIVGCESGRGARECDVEWLRSIRDQCAAADVAHFLKQAEESADLGEDRLLDIGDDDSIAFDSGSRMKARRPGGHHIIELPYLDGVQHAAFPRREGSR